MRWGVYNLTQGDRTVFALVVPRPEAEPITPHLAFFQRVQAMIRKRLADERCAGASAAANSDIDAAVRQVIGGAVEAGEVIDLFAAAGLEGARLDFFRRSFSPAWPRWSRRTSPWRHCANS